MVSGGTPLPPPPLPPPDAPAPLALGAAGAGDGALLSTSPLEKVLTSAGCGHHPTRRGGGQQRRQQAALHREGPSRVKPQKNNSRRGGGHTKAEITSQPQRQCTSAIKQHTGSVYARKAPVEKATQGHGRHAQKQHERREQQGTTEATRRQRNAPLRTYKTRRKQHAMNDARDKRRAIEGAIVFRDRHELVDQRLHVLNVV